MTLPLGWDVSAAAGTRLPLILLILKATCLLLAALGVTLMMERAAAGVRHLVWLVVLAALLVLPAIAAWSPLRLEILPDAFALAQPGRGAAVERDEGTLDSKPRLSAPESRDRVRRGATSGAAPGEQIDASPNAERTSVFTGQVIGSGRLGLASTVLLAWATVALILGGWLAFGALSVRTIVRRARPLDSPDWKTPLYEIADRLQLADVPRLLRSERVKMPFACGLLHPTIVLPAEADGWSADRRSAVLLHELGHVRRRDLVGHTLGRLACALYWFHPLVWTAARKLRSESERACDDLALTCGARPSEYAEHLLDIVTCVRDHATPAVALAMAHRREFEGRMLAILDPELRRKEPSRGQSLSLVGGLAILAVVVSAAAPATSAGTSEAATQALSSPVVAANHANHRTVLVDSQMSVSLHAENDRQVRMSVIPAPGASVKAGKSGPDAQGSGGTAESSMEADAEVRARELMQRIALPTDGQDASQQKGGDDRPVLLAQVLRTDSSAALRRVAAWGLHEYADTDVAAAALASAVLRDSNAAVREMAAWALADADGSSKATEALTTAMKRDADPKVRATATWALGNIGDEDAVPAISESLGSDEAKLRRLAAWAIGSIAPRRAPRALIAAVADRDPDVRKVAAWALYEIADPDAVPALDAALNRETDREVQHSFIRALAATGEKSVDAIRRLIDSKDPDVRAAAIRALAGQSASPWPWPWPNPRPFP